MVLNQRPPGPWLSWHLIFCIAVTVLILGLILAGAFDPKGKP
jgi:hypothetical protein